MPRLALTLPLLFIMILSISVITIFPGLAGYKPRNLNFYLIQIGNTTNSGGIYSGLISSSNPSPLSNPTTCNGGPVCFNGTIPGPTITVNQGDIVNVTVHNISNLTHTFTLTIFGVNIVNASGQTQSAQFTANAVGGFHYMCTQPGHATLGMYGIFTVNPTAAAPLSLSSILGATLAAVMMAFLIVVRRRL